MDRWHHTCEVLYQQITKYLVKRLTKIYKYNINGSKTVEESFVLVATVLCIIWFVVFTDITTSKKKSRTSIGPKYRFEVQNWPKNFRLFHKAKLNVTMLAMGQTKASRTKVSQSFGFVCWLCFYIYVLSVILYL